jgi:NADPH:quinone reductase-like Zn-dependent oxidoreductase
MSIAETPSPTKELIEATCLRLDAKAADATAIAPRVVKQPMPRPRSDEALVEVRAAAVNPSDVKAAIGLMPYAVFPRTPGRDFAGLVVDGPAHLLGKAVFGSSGDLGIRRDGTHASHLVVEAEALVEKPTTLTLAEAAGIGVPFVTALEGFRRAGMPGAGDVVLILGLNGKVGQAAAQIASWRGARVLGVVRRPEPYTGHAQGAVEVIDASSQDVAARVHELTGGRGADIVFNTVGDPYYATGTASLAKLGRQIFIAAVDRIVSFDIFAFYRGRHTYVGIDTLALSSIETGALLRELQPGFARGELKPFPILPEAIYPLSKAKDAYVAVLGSSRDRLILRPED